jgi:hypothetical protein
VAITEFLTLLSGIPASPILKTERAMQFVGPAAFNIDVQYSVPQIGDFQGSKSYFLD